MSSGEDIANACKKVSSEAENIKAKGDAAAKSGINALFNLIGNSIKEGRANTEAETQLKNIVQIDLTSKQIVDIATTCNNTVAVNQTNVITNDCPYCQTYGGCDVDGVTQVNDEDVNSQCYMTSLMDIMSKQEASADTAAKTMGLQQTQGILASSVSKVDGCNYLKSTATSDDYYRMISSCANQTISNQTNLIGSNCGKAANLVQKNSYRSFLLCTLQSDVSTWKGQSSDAVADIVTETNQKTTGVDFAAIIQSIGGAISSVFSGGALLIAVIIGGLLIAGVIFLRIIFGGGSGGGGGVGQGGMSDYPPEEFVPYRSYDNYAPPPQYYSKIQQL